MTEDPEGAEPRRSAAPRIVAALAVAACMSVLVYLLLDTARPSSALIGFTFLLVLPAAVRALTGSSPTVGQAQHGLYVGLPFWTLLGLIAISVAVLREGTVWWSSCRHSGCFGEWRDRCWSTGSVGTPSVIARSVRRCCSRRCWRCNSSRRCPSPRTATPSAHDRRGSIARADLAVATRHSVG
jgi:hypothetical protein